MLRREDINIRDTYVLVSGNKYYMYGTRSATTWSKTGGLDVYVSTDLENFEGPIEILPEKDKNYWAPECYEINDRFYLLVTVLEEGKKKGIYTFVSDNPAGPYEQYSERYTPENWTCIDGTFYFENGQGYLIYSHSFEDLLDPSAKEIASGDGDYCMQKLSADLKKTISEPEIIFKAKDCKWAKPVPFAKQEFGIEEDIYFSDGPSLMRLEDGRVYMLNSSWSKAGYAVGVASSQVGVLGPWSLQEEPLFPENGGHGMLFRNLENKLIFALHYPNDKYAERPYFAEVSLEDGELHLCNNCQYL